MKTAEDTEDAEVFISKSPPRPRRFSVAPFGNVAAVEADGVAARRRHDSRRKAGRRYRPDGATAGRLF